MCVRVCLMSFVMSWFVFLTSPPRTPFSYEGTNTRCYSHHRLVSFFLPSSGLGFTRVWCVSVSCECVCVWCVYTGT